MRRATAMGITISTSRPCQGGIVAATATLTEALAGSPGDRLLRLALAAVRCQAGDWSAALALLETLQSEGGFDPVVDAYRAGALLATGRVAEAKDTLDAAA